jgi:hypothetical protein
MAAPIDKPMVWRFTVENGRVKGYGLRDSVPPKELLWMDEHGKEVFRVPILSPTMVKRIERAVRGKFGKYVSGEGTYDEESELMNFIPSRNAVN